MSGDAAADLTAFRGAARALVGAAVDAIEAMSGAFRALDGRAASTHAPPP